MIVVDASAMIEALVADRVHPALLDALDDDVSTGTPFMPRSLRGPSGDPPEPGTS